MSVLTLAPVDVSTHPAAPALEGRRMLALFLVFAGFYLLTASGHFYNVDEEALYLVTEGLVERHSVALPRGAWGTGWPLSTVDHAAPGEPIYSTFAPGQSLAAAPLYLAGRAAASFLAPARGYLTRWAVSLLNAFVTAATVALLYWLARMLAYRGRAALGLAVTYGVATFAWPHGRTFLAEPLTVLLLLAAFAALRRGTATPRGIGWLIAAGAAAAAAVATKPHALLALPILTLYLLARAAALPGRVIPDRRAWVGGVGAALCWGCGLALVGLPYAAYNTAIYGRPFTTGYADVGWTLFTTPFLTGLVGLTISSGKGLLWYAPPVVLAVAGWPGFYRRHRAEALTCLGLTLAHLIFYSRVRFWHGDWSWGPRFLLLALPFTLLPLAALFESVCARRGRRALVLVVVTLGVVVQLLGSLVNFGWAIVRSPDETARWFAPRAAPILAHARLLAARSAEWRRVVAPPGDTAVLTSGFAAPESARHTALFPRWTTGAGTITLYLARPAPLTVKVSFFDHRPPALRTTEATILVNGEPLPGAALDRRGISADGTGWVYVFTVPPTAFHGGAATVTVRSATWNPRALGIANRDETLGVFVHDVEVWRAGRPFTLSQARAVPPALTDPQALYLWFNDDRAADTPAVDAPAYHLIDWWAWYLTQAGFGRRQTSVALAGYGGGATLILSVGLALGLAAWPRWPAEGSADSGGGDGEPRPDLLPPSRAGRSRRRPWWAMGAEARRTMPKRRCPGDA